jgi:outer membrane protein assembly factor BamB
MKTIKKRATIICITIFLIVSISASIALPITDAHTPAWTIPTYSFVVASPNPVGVDQPTSIVMWVDQSPPTAVGNDGDRWHGYQVNITKPDGSSEIIKVPDSSISSTSSAWIQYTPRQVGTYTVVFSWPGQTLTNGTGTPATAGVAFVGDYFKGATSEPATFKVQEEPITDWQEPPLPTEYWTRPINAANRGWSGLASNWLKGGWLVDAGYLGQYNSAWPSYYQTEGTAPASSHIVWTKPEQSAVSGGIMDAQWAGYSGDSRWSAPIIMNGKIYANAPQYGYFCLDLRTGEQLWFKNSTDNGLNGEIKTLTQGQLFHFHSVLTDSIYSYLISISGSTWYFINPDNGNYLFKIVNVPSGIAATDEGGSLMLYSYNPATGNLLGWNNTQAILPSGPTGVGQVTWSPGQGATYDAVNDTTWLKAGPSASIMWDDILPHSGYTMNVTIAKDLAPLWYVMRDTNRVPKMVMGMTFTNGIANPSTNNGWGLCPGGVSDTFSAWVATIDEHVAPFSPFPNKSYSQNNNHGYGATVLWNKNFLVPLPGMNYTWKFADINYDSQTFVIHCKQTRQLWAYSLKTGEMLWGPTPQENVMGYYDTGLAELASQTRTFYGMTMQSGLTGTLYSYNASTGKLLWTYNATGVGHESPYGENYPLFFAAVGDGKIYLYTNEHTPTKPLLRGSYLRCINATDGTEIWKLQNWVKGQGLSLADGYIVNSNYYDNNIYCIGKGPSALTVDAPKTGIKYGDSLVISGTITDISPGAKQTGVVERFPNGLPVVSEANMDKWMEYVYQQQSRPTNVIGVPVTISVLDSNGNYREIGAVTSDSDGFFSLNWKPDIEGSYTVYASFAGSNSYWPSHAVTAFAIDPVAATPASTTTPQLDTATNGTLMTTMAVGVVAIIIAIAIVGLLMLRKRP